MSATQWTNMKMDAGILVLKWWSHLVLSISVWSFEPAVQFVALPHGWTSFFKRTPAWRQRSAKVWVFVHAWLHLLFPVFPSVSLPPPFPPCHTSPPQRGHSGPQRPSGNSLEPLLHKTEVKSEMSDILSPAKVNTQLLLALQNTK